MLCIHVCSTSLMAEDGEGRAGVVKVGDSVPLNVIIMSGLNPKPKLTHIISTIIHSSLYSKG